MHSSQSKTYAVFTVGMSRNPLLPVVVIRRAGASLLLAFVPPSLSETDALNTLAKKSQPFVTPPFWSCSCCCCCCCCSCCWDGARFLWSLLKGLLLTVIFWLMGLAPGRLEVEEKLGGMTNSMSFFALRQNNKTISSKLMHRKSQSTEIEKYWLEITLPKVLIESGKQNKTKRITHCYNWMKPSSTVIIIKTPKTVSHKTFF